MGYKTNLIYCTHIGKKKEKKKKEEKSPCISHVTSDDICEPEPHYDPIHFSQSLSTSQTLIVPALKAISQCRYA